MKVAAVSMIKDECDIIESFIRINAAWADHFFILDNGSSDHTLHILRLLSDERYPITVASDGAIDYPQEQKTTFLVKRVAARREFDFIFPIDGDEFIADADVFRASLADVSAGRVGSVEWSGLVPNDSSAMKRPAPLIDGFSRRRTELRSVRKIILPNDLALTASIAMGNHFATAADGKRVPDVRLPVPLYHVPVRSKEQIIAKSLIGSNKLSIKKGRTKFEGIQWDLIAQMVRISGFELTDEQLREIALSYGWPADDPRMRDVVPISISTADQVPKYAELSSVNVPMLLEGFAQQLCHELLAARSSAPALRRLFHDAMRNRLLRKAVRSLR